MIEWKFEEDVPGQYSKITEKCVSITCDKCGSKTYDYENEIWLELMKKTGYGYVTFLNGKNELENYKSLDLCSCCQKNTTISELQIIGKNVYEQVH